MSARDRVRQAARAGGFVGVTAVMLPAMLLDIERRPAARREGVRDAWVRAWAKRLLRLFAIDVVVDGAVPPPASRPRGRLIVANHRSAIDIGVLLSVFGGTMVSRADLATWPVIGAAARAVGTVFVDRTSARSGAATIRLIEQRLAEGSTIALFAEGTTFDGDEVRPFHTGAFVAALRAGAELVPVGLAYPADSGAAFFKETFPEHLARMARSTATRMVLSVGEPVVAPPGDKAARLASHMQAEVQTLVSRARVVCGP